MSSRFKTFGHFLRYFERPVVLESNGYCREAPGSVLVPCALLRSSRFCIEQAHVAGVGLTLKCLETLLALLELA